MAILLFILFILNFNNVLSSPNSKFQATRMLTAIFVYFHLQNTMWLTWISGSVEAGRPWNLHSIFVCFYSSPPSVNRESKWTILYWVQFKYVSVCDKLEKCYCFEETFSEHTKDRKNSSFLFSSMLSWNVLPPRIFLPFIKLHLVIRQWRLFPHLRNTG